MSNADVIYSHINSNDIQKIEVNSIDMFFNHIAKKTQITIDTIKENERLNKKMLFEAHLLRPYYNRFIKFKEEIYGNYKTWDNEIRDKVDNEFYKKYVENKKTYNY